MILGDTHGNVLWLERAVISACQEADVELILQVGDWGFMWPGDDTWVETGEMLREAGIPMWFIDGNHDDHPRLRKSCRGQDREERGSWEETGEWLSYLPRGYRFELDGCTFLCLGGAYSVDKHHRVEGLSWWREEEISYMEARRAADGGYADVMLVHDLPWGVELKWDRKAEFPETTPNRKTLRQVIDQVQPRWVFGGHMHYRQTTVLPLRSGHRVRVETLNCDGTGPEAWMIVDTEELKA